MRLVIVGLGVALWAATLAAAPQQPDRPAQADTRPSFLEWLQSIRDEALARGIRPETVDRALSTVEEPLPVVIERDRAQAEAVLPLETYLARSLRGSLVRAGRVRFVGQKQTLDEVERRYGVPARIIAGIWGIESNFGRFTGTRPTVPALATLAWDPRRPALFRSELFAAMEIVDRGDIDLGDLRGSWAGAMGQPQFMPSSYLKFAADFDGDGRRDIWQTTGDVFASIANYLRGHGWTSGQAWGREVRVPKTALSRIAARIGRREGTCRASRDMTVPLPLSEWQGLGVRTLSGGALPRSAMEASLVSGATRHFLVYPNYDALLQYNCAHAYALSVALLGDRLAAQPAPAAR